MHTCLFFITVELTGTLKLIEKLMFTTTLIVLDRQAKMANTTITTLPTAIPTPTQASIMHATIATVSSSTNATDKFEIPTVPTGMSSPSWLMNNLAVIVIVVGGAVVINVLGCSLYCLIRKCRKSRRNGNDNA